MSEQEDTFLRDVLRGQQLANNARNPSSRGAEILFELDAQNALADGRISATELATYAFSPAAMHGSSSIVNDYARRIARAGSDEGARQVAELLRGELLNNGVPVDASPDQIAQAIRGSSVRQGLRPALP